MIAPNVPSRTMLTFTNEVKDLALAIEQIPECEQVRVYPVLKQSIRDVAGDSALTFLCMVKHKTQSDRFIEIATFVPDTIYNDRNKHLEIIQNIKDKVKDYYSSGVMPINVM